MIKINDIENLNIENNNDIEIEYNEEFTSEKIKSLIKFPSKLNQSKEFYLDNSRKNFSKSLGFNFRQCFAPKFKIKISNKNPSPLKFEKNENNINLNSKNQIISEDALSEKESSFNNESSFSSDSEKDSEIEENINIKNSMSNTEFINDIKNNQNNNDHSISTPENENINKNININEIKNNESKNHIKQDKTKGDNKKSYEHITIAFFNSKNSNSKDNIKSIRNNLFKIKKKNLQKMYRETEYLIKQNEKIKYRLDLLKKNNNTDNEYKIIPINNIEENNNSDEDDTQDMSNFRTTISYSDSKSNKEKNTKKEKEGYTIFHLLRSNKNK